MYQEENKPNDPEKILTTIDNVDTFKGRVHCFSMQVVMNKCFVQNPQKILALIRFYVVFEKNAKTHTLIPKNDVTEPKAMLL